MATPGRQHGNTPPGGVGARSGLVLRVLLLLAFAAPAFGLKFTFKLVGKGDSAGAKGSISVTINQKIRSIINDGFDTSITPTATYKWTVNSKLAKAGYARAVFGMSKGLKPGANGTALEGIVIGAVDAPSSKALKFGGDLFSVLPVCSTPCEFGGFCYAKDSCSCPDGYTGPSCENRICTKQCLHGGNCTYSDTCICDRSNWEGDQCEKQLCPTICQNGGFCVTAHYSDTDVRKECRCPGNWTGDSCEISRCTDPAYPACDQPICKKPCLNGGNCTYNNYCTCDDMNWEGDQCEKQLCPTICQNGGFCVTNYINWPDVRKECRCPGNWTGDSCEISRCTDPAYPACDKPICKKPCLNGGNCTFDDFCECDWDNYEGDQCEKQSCPALCRNGGSCGYGWLPNGTVFRQCDCTDAWTGPTCEDRSCPLGCHNGGSCGYYRYANGTEYRECSCTYDWTGPSCEQPICGVICRNGGYCGYNWYDNGTEYRECSCTYDWTGPSCEQPNCDPACDNGGTCVLDGTTGMPTCNCTTGFTGTGCSDPVSPASPFSALKAAGAAAQGALSPAEAPVVLAAIRRKAARRSAVSGGTRVAAAADPNSPEGKWDRLEPLMDMICDDSGIVVAKRDASGGEALTAMVSFKLPGIYKRYYCEGYY
ncbi:MAG: hypothetical protein J3K34DRAFT_417934 [Monoraphidium minutum]|nr:MAG: hypothetical protein J3K34DRAFT_417934 [Monoraphidium minutum]